MPQKNLNAPLYTRDLRDIWEHCPTPEVRALLWEIDRMGRLLYEADQVLAAVPRPATGAPMYAHVRNLLNAEPAVLKQRRIESAARQRMTERQREGTFGCKQEHGG